MHRTVVSLAAFSCAILLSTGLARAAEQAKPADAKIDPAMEAMMKLGSPGEAHKVLESLAGSWSYTGQFWMTPDAPPEAMTGTGTNTLIYGGRFLKQKFAGQMKDMPAFEGTGITGYDNIRKEYQSIWFDNMSTGLMTSTGQFDAATKTLSQSGDFSCPMTGETHRKMRSDWKIVDADHHTYVSFSTTPEGREYKSMEIAYTRAE